MKDKDNLFIWGDNWWIEGERAWFVWGMENILFCMDLIRGKCESAVCIPDTNQKTFRLTPNCIKYNNNIFCMPGLGKSIWIYDLECQKFSKIDIDNPSKSQLGFDFWICGDRLWAVSAGEFGKIIEMNIRQKRVENYYTLCEKGKLARSVMAKNVIYTLAADSNVIYEFNIRTRILEICTLPNIRGKLWTICFDGEKFWLSGFQKEVYVWNKETNILHTITDFPKGFGIYDFTKETTTGEVDCISEQYEYHAFNFSVLVGNKVWFIPYNANKVIYSIKGSYELHEFEICEEKETRESIKARTSLGYKYLLEYVKDDRYLGLFSIKNNCMLEIDAVEMRYVYKQYEYCAGIGVKCLNEYSGRRDGIFYEKISWDREVYQGLVKAQKFDPENVKENNVGKSIYRKITQM